MGSSYFVVVLLPSPARSTNTSGKMSETEAKTDAVAEQPTRGDQGHQEIRGGRRGGSQEAKD